MNLIHQSQFIWQTQCIICHNQAEQKELEQILNIDTMYSDQNPVDTANYINMIHRSIGNNAKRIIKRINSTSKQYQARIMHEIQKVELAVTNYCNQYQNQAIPSDIIHLCITFYINVKCPITSYYSTCSLKRISC